MSKAMKKCEVCGAPLTGKQEKFCSVKCSNARDKTLYSKKCEECGKEFMSNQKAQKYCCHKCARKHYSPRKSDGELNRPYTDETAYLIRLWTRQGKSVLYIAEVLGRSVENVRLALK